MIETVEMCYFMPERMFDLSIKTCFVICYGLYGQFKQRNFVGQH